MKIISGLVLTLLAVGLFSAYTPKEEGIKFYYNLEEAKKVAKAENKLIFLDGYASWCGPCKMMDRKVFSNSSVGAFYNKHFISVKIDMDKNARLRNFYKVRAYPTLLYLNADGEIISKKVGYHDSEDFVELGEKAKSKS